MLEQQTYIQKNGELFEFLTKEEKDVKPKSKMWNWTVRHIVNNFELFSDILASPKITYTKLGIDYNTPRRLHELKGNPAEPV